MINLEYNDNEISGFASGNVQHVSAEQFTVYYMYNSLILCSFGHLRLLSMSEIKEQIGYDGKAPRYGPFRLKVIFIPSGEVQYSSLFWIASKLEK